MIIEVLGYIAVCLIAIGVYLQIRNTMQISRAEEHMAAQIVGHLTQQKLESLRDDLLELKGRAIEAGYEEMDFHEIEYKINLLAEKLNSVERQLIAQGLKQASSKGRLEYMLKLVDLSLTKA